MLREEFQKFNSTLINADYKDLWLLVAEFNDITIAVLSNCQL
ncbi:MAG: hypothetical protein MAG551_01358 [Candidatus Scalindua arabica]|uniref:Uncharacterized protein n=1 Tax=Candidatus Scalindua arabica TaxID=1127984 RepID=A0A942A2A6_9BACT|nr:hypothetical protein [Candidatus Scalindua arabica]